MGKILTIGDQRIFNSYLTTGLPASILLGQSHLQGYYLENYIQMNACRDIYDDVTFAITDALDYTHPECMDESVMKLSYVSAYEMSQLNINAIKDFLISSIENNDYIIAFLDEYYIPERVSTEKHHFIHESLIYGYDSNFFHVLNFDSKGLYTRQKWRIDDVIRSISHGIEYANERLDWISSKYVSIYQISQKEKYVADKCIIANKIMDYVNAVEVFTVFTDLDIAYSAFGIKCVGLIVRQIDYFIGILNSKDTQNYYDKVFGLYCAVQLFVDHKRGLNERISFILPLKYSTQIMYEENIVLLAEKIRMLLLKTLYTNGSGKIIMILQNIKGKLYELQEREFLELNNILHLI